MAADEVTIFNLALEGAGTRSDVAATTEQSREAEVCRLWYPICRDLVLHASNWNSVRAYERLATLRTRGDTTAWDGSVDPAPGYAYTHASPATMLRPQYLTTFERFEPGVLDNVKVIHSQNASPILVFTKNDSVPAFWEHDLFVTVAMTLSAFITIPLTGKTQRAKDKKDEANVMILQARTNNANQENVQFETMPSWIAARGSAYGVSDARFYYPSGPLISLTELAGVA